MHSMEIMYPPLLRSAEINNHDFSDKSSRKRPRSSSAENSHKKRRAVSMSVRFSPFAVEIETESVSTTWYTRSEYADFKLNIKRDVYHLAALCNQGRVHELDRNEFCPLGLEKYCTPTAQQVETKSLRQQRIKAVLGQQTVQKLMGWVDPEALRLVAKTFSQQAVAKGIARASRRRR